MLINPKTIQIFLPSGDPRGIRIAEITTRIVQVIEVPRSLLGEFFKMEESNQVAIYFLFGGEEDGSDQKVYIGQTGGLQDRLKNHNIKKEFWERALVLISRTHSLTQTHTLFLESLCLEKAKEAGRYLGENGNGGSKPHTPLPLEAECLEIFETGSTLLSTLGYPIFSPVVAAPSMGIEDRMTYLCTASKTNGRGMYTPEGFVVLKESVGRTAMTDAVASTSFASIRNKILHGNDVQVLGDSFVMKSDRLFNTPSAAAKFLTGGSKNGWITWVTADGRTLDEVERQKSN